ncbi:MAG: hypothetical protein M1821_002203 [Bathelium mastoideum]|nr:MAG: hypothetical protein M1821_002203 [Bathelium mastoideum]
MISPFRTLLSLFLLFPTLSLSISCIPNPAYTVPPLQASDPLLTPLRAALDATIRDLLVLSARTRTEEEQQSQPSWANVTSFSVAVTTREEKVWEWHHSAAVQGHGSCEARSMEEHGDELWEGSESRGEGAGFSGRARAQRCGGKVVDGSTVYRIASCTKVFTVLALLLQEGVNWDDPVTKWIPELRWDRSESVPGEGIEDLGGAGQGEDQTIMNHVQWDSITLRSLASQLSGLARDYATFDILDRVPEPWSGRLEELGFPPLDENDDTPFGNNTSDKDMSQEDFLNGVKNQHPIFAPDYQSSYSNTNFILLGMVLEKMTGQKYADIIAERITGPLGLNRTTFKKPSNEDGAIPAGPNDWNFGNERIGPTGGLYSTTDDTTTFLRSLLRSEQLGLETTNKWLHVQSGSPGLAGFYGMPWEIFRTSQVTSDNRTITIVTKSGGLVGYYSQIALIPEFGLGVSILTAGNQDALATLERKVHGVLLTTIDQILQQHTEDTYTGTFAARGDLNSSLDLGIGATGGLEIKKWISNGTDFLNAFAKVTTWPPFETNSTMEGKQARVWPMGIQRGRKDATDPLAVGEVWRMHILQLETASKVWTEFCMGDADEGAYGGRTINELLLYKGADGKVEKVKIPALKVELVRKKALMEFIEGAKGVLEQFRLW